VAWKDGRRCALVISSFVKTFVDSEVSYSRFKDSWRWQPSKINQKRFIVQALACYGIPSEVSAALKEEMGIDVARTQVAQYDPTKVAGAKLSKTVA
jgi:hypothetical protein